jgi:CubicO group peptidase (beta-lactamase class C family)
MVGRDDPISKFIPELDYMTQEHSPGGKKEEVITFRQVMSHMAGLGREHPDGDASGHWPEELGTNGPPWVFGRQYPNFAVLLQEIADRHLITTPYKFPSYSNTGFALLGAANLAAVRKFEGDAAPTSHADLIKRDIFDKLDLNGSSFLADDSNRRRVVVPSRASYEVVSLLLASCYCF